MDVKKNLGQFFTTNVDRILHGFEDVIKGKEVLDPFAGGGDLLMWADKHAAKHTRGLDIDPKLIKDKITLNDSLMAIPHAKFILTNPPYLGKNKMTAQQKSSYMRDVYEDFYLLAIKKIIDADPDEGLIIIPVNFFSAENSDKLRVEFLDKYLITKVNYFKEQVFDDTTYNVVAFHYVRKTSPSNKQKLTIISYPGADKKTFSVEHVFDYRIAGKELNEIVNIKPMKTIRLTEQHMKENVGNVKVRAFFNDKSSKNSQEYMVNENFYQQIRNNVILLNCIDTNGNEDGWIKAENIRDFDKDCLVGKNTSRNIAYVMIPDCSKSMQKKIIPMFNRELNRLRKDYNSLFLTNFRDNDRKRISFDFCYKLITYCYNVIKEMELKTTNIQDSQIALMTKLIY